MVWITILCLPLKIHRLSLDRVLFKTELRSVSNHLESEVRRHGRFVFQRRFDIVTSHYWAVVQHYSSESALH